MIDPHDPPVVWTVKEANGVLAHVTEVVLRARMATQSLRDRAPVTAARAKTNGHGASHRRDADALDAAIRELANEGILLRDVEQGLIDFPARAPSGRPYWLCWVVGEPKVTWWHWPEDGFAGRTPIDEPPA